jgi:Winged helix DNA-binding domain
LALTAQRLAAQLLSGAAGGDVLAVPERLLAVQGQDPRGVRLAIRARTTGLRAADVDRALSDERSLLITWLNRGTLHLVRSEDYWWLHPLITPPLVIGNARRLGQEGVSPMAAERGVAVIEGVLASDGPLIRTQLREEVRAAGVPVAGQALVHLLMLASLRGLIVRGPMMGGEQAHVLVRDWLGSAPPPVDRDAALVLLARRYLAGHGPATDRDLARWAGVPLGDARRGLRAAGRAVEARADGLLQLASHGDLAREQPLPRPKLLGSFDPLLLGWVSRKPILGPHLSVVTVNGIFRPFALVDGRAVATWRLAGKQVVLAPFGPLNPADEAALDADAVDVQRFLG